MATQTVTSINCPNCRTPFTAPIEQILDAQDDPEAKSRLLAGQLNVFLCPHCGFQGALNAPFVYHDAEFELALVYMPMEVGPTDLERQQAIGELTNRLMQQVPPEARKGYLLQPQTFLSIQSLVDAMLDKDEATREMVETQRRKMDLLDQLRQLDPDDRLASAEYVGKNDHELDETFFQLLDIVINLAESQGNTVERDRLIKHREFLLEKSTVGQLFSAQQAALDALSANPTRDTLVDQLVAAEDRRVREALVTIGRQLLDYSFFQLLTARIDASGDGDEKEKLIALRKEVQEIRDDVDAMARAVLEARAKLLMDLLMTDDPKEMLQRHITEVDNAFLGVLSTNMQEAQREGRQDLVRQLQEIGDAAVELLNQYAPPEYRLINRLAEASDDEQVDRILTEERERLNEEFLALVESAITDLERAERQESVERLRHAAEYIKGLVAI